MWDRGVVPVSVEKEDLRAFLIGGGGDQVFGSTSLDTIGLSGQNTKITNISGFLTNDTRPYDNTLRGQCYEDDEKIVKYIGKSRIIIKKSDFSKKNYKNARIKPIRERKICQKHYSSSVCQECGEVYVFPISCDKRTCPDCAREFADRLYFRLKDVISNMKEIDGFRFRFLTLTRKTTNDDWRDEDTIRKRVRETWNAFKKLYHNRIETGWEKVLENGKWIEKKSSYKGKVGVLSVMEFGGKRLNIHIHALIYSKWIDQKELSDEWLRLTGDSFIVHIEEVKGKAGEKALRELTKYCCDISNLNEHQRNMVEVALKGSRRVRTLGIFYNSDKLKDEKIETARKCLRCGSELKLIFRSTGVITNDIWKRILYQCAMWEIDTAQLEKIMSVKKSNGGSDDSKIQMQV